MLDHFTEERYIRNLIQGSFKRIFPFADNCHDPARLFYGSDQGVGYHNARARIDTVKVFVNARQAIFEQDVARHGEVNKYNRDLGLFLKSVNLVAIDNVPAEDYMLGFGCNGNSSSFKVKNGSVMKGFKGSSGGCFTPSETIETLKSGGDRDQRYIYNYRMSQSPPKMVGSNLDTALKPNTEAGYRGRAGIKKVKVKSTITASSLEGRAEGNTCIGKKETSRTGNLIFLRPEPQPPPTTALVIKRYYNPTTTLIFQDRRAKGSEPPIQKIPTQEDNQLGATSEPKPYLREFNFDKAESHCVLLHRFLQGKIWLYHNELFGLLTNMAQLKGGKKRFFEAMTLVPEYQAYNKVNELAFAYNWINKHRFRPTTCQKYCPFCNECNPERPTLWQLDYSKHAYKVIKEQDAIPWTEGHNRLSNAMVHWLEYTPMPQRPTGSVTCIKADTGVGKTHLIRDLVVPGGLIIAVPTHSLIHEYQDKTHNPNIIIIPEEPVHELSKEKQQELESARKRGLIDKISRIWQQASKTNSTVKDYLDSIAEAKENKDKTVIMTHERYLLSGVEYPQQTVIIDEDITRAAISNSTISYTDFITTLGLLEASGFDTSSLRRTLDSVEDVVCPTPHMPNQKLNRLKKAINDQPEIQVNLLDLVQSTYFIRWSQWSNTDKPADIHYVKRRAIPTNGKRVLMLSATITEEVVRSLFRYHHNVGFQDIGRIEHKGTVIQFTNAGSFSRTYLSKSPDMRKKLKEYLKPVNTITFKDYKFDENDLHYHALSGIDSLGGKPVAIVGTPNENYASLILLATSLGWCKPGVKYEQTPTWVTGTYNGILSTLYTYRDEGLRKTQKYVVESSLTQAIGRARTTREESAVAFVFSNWPLAGVQRENLPSALEADTTKGMTIRDDYPALLHSQDAPRKILQSLSLEELSKLEGLGSLGSLSNPDKFKNNEGFKIQGVFFLQEVSEGATTEEGVAKTA